MTGITFIENFIDNPTELFHKFKNNIEKHIIILK